ncbi:MAG: hypothetical protein QXU88_00500 [Candidatus Woesearchaeota archaeon]
MPKEVPKFGVKEVLQFVGIRELEPEEQEVLHRLSTEYYEKIKRDLPNLIGVTVHVKCYEKEGRRKKYSLHVRVGAPTKVIESCNADDWEFSRAIHKAFKDVRQQIVHIFRTDVTRPKPYG